MLIHVISPPSVPSVILTAKILLYGDVKRSAVKPKYACRRFAPICEKTFFFNRIRSKPWKRSKIVIFKLLYWWSILKIIGKLVENIRVYINGDARRPIMKIYWPNHKRHKTRERNAFDLSWTIAVISCK